MNYLNGDMHHFLIAAQWPFLPASVNSTIKALNTTIVVSMK